MATRKTTDDPQFEEAWALYPRKPGDNKNDARKAWDARRKEGHDPIVMIAGVKAYAAWVKYTKTQPQHVKRGQTFFGPSLHFLNDYQQIELPTDMETDLLNYYDREKLV